MGNITKDSEHLVWIHDRIIDVYGESKNVDFLIRLREIIKNTEDLENGLENYLKYRHEKQQGCIIKPKPPQPPEDRKLPEGGPIKQPKNYKK